MSTIRDELKYTADHEWVSIESGSATARIGITDFAQSALGDIVYVSLPEIGISVTKGSAVGEVESTKSVSDIYAPLSGTIAGRNEALDDQPDLVNSDPYGAGWILEIEMTDAAEADELLDAAAYGSLAQ